MTTSRHRDGRRAPDFSLVLPAFDPGARLGRTLDELADFAAGAPENWEFVFVCDGCRDGSDHAIRNWSPRRGSVRLLSHTPNRGKGYAVRQGLLAASAPYRIFTDIDLAYTFTDIRRVAAVLRAGKPVVIGSRAHQASVVQLPVDLLAYAWRRHFQSRLFGAVARVLLPITQRDSQAGLKGLSEAAVRAVIPRLHSDGFEFDCELLTACSRLSIEVSEVPVCVRYAGTGTTTGVGAGAGMVSKLWRIRKAWSAKMPPVELDRPPGLYREAG